MKDGRTESSYRFWDVPVKVEGGQFFIDSVEGLIPEQFKDFVEQRFSIQEFYIKGDSRPKGIYQNDDHPEAKGEVEPAVMDDKPRYNLYVVGSKLESVIGLFRAIVNNELLPVSAGKTAPELVTELQAQIDGCQAMIAQLKERNEGLDHGLMTLEDANRHLQSEAKSLREELETTKTSLAQMTSHCIWFSNRYAKLYREWYRLPFIIISGMLYGHAPSDLIESNQRIKELSSLCNSKK